MKNFKDRYPDRECREVFAVSEEQRVCHVQGFDCKPNNPDCWWIPELGLSMRQGTRLFKTEGEALKRVIDECIEERKRATTRINDALQRLDTLCSQLPPSIDGVAGA